MDPRGRRIPAEWELHQRIIMAWPTHWGPLNPKFQGDVARVAQAVSRFESVQMLVRPEHVEEAKASVGKGQTHEIEFLPIPVNDLWARDFIPLFMTRPKDGAGGGGIESDGQGTLLMTESSIVNDNRNPNKTRSDLEETFKEELGIKKVIWLKGLKGYDITDSHIDALARFVAPGVVMVSKPPPESQTQGLPLHSKWFQAWRDQYAQAIQVLSTTTDAKGNSLRIIDLPEPNPSKTRRILPEEVAVFEEIGVETCEKDGSGGINTYLNFLMVNGGIVMPEFGDEEADAEAKRIVEEQFPDREVETVRIDYLVKGGGGIHCSTHDVPIV
ncbi:hypothetical protein BGZ91_007115 [Linnemannia elongata]|nr:hypothetical protein BGZ91_007115 [Linnemannia elongata]